MTTASAIVLWLLAMLGFSPADCEDTSDDEMEIVLTSYCEVVESTTETTTATRAQAGKGVVVDISNGF